jgi:hypothetical protein
VKVYPDPLVISDVEGFASTKDLFGRASLGSGLSNLVTVVENPMVIAVDGVWGSGKSTFLKMWGGELRKANFPVIAFDAFENDYVDDAFAVLAREIVELSEQSKSTAERVTENVKEKAVQLGSLLLRSAGKVAINVGVRAATAGLASASDFSDLAGDLEAEAAGIADKYMEDLLSKPSEQKMTAERFREALSALPAALQNGDAAPKPLIFIIDELDRCKPGFALSILERIKHFMSVPNVHFVLGVNLRQLEASVRAVYGSDIDAPAYLEKFINLTVHNADTGERPEERQLKKYADYLQKSLQIPTDNDSPYAMAAATLVRVLEARGVSFRTLERAFTLLQIAIAFVPSNSIRYGAILGGLIVLKMFHPNLYLKAKAGNLTLEEVRSALGLAPLGENTDRRCEWEAQWWTYCLSSEIPEELDEFAKSFWHFDSFGERSGIVTYHANEILDRLQP